MAYCTLLIIRDSNAMYHRRQARVNLEVGSVI